MTFPVTEGNTMTVEVTPETTRNHDSVIFNLDRNLLPPGTGSTYPDSDLAKDNPLASALFKIKGVTSVWILGNQVQVSKDERVSWGRISSRIIETIKKTLA